MATLTRENLLITVGASGSAVTSGLLVSEASISLAPEIESRRTLSAAPTWGHSGPPVNTIQLRGNLAQNMANLLSFATGETQCLVFRISSGVFSGCYLEEFEIEGESHSPISYQAQFKFWQQPSGSFNSSYTLTGTTGISSEFPFHSQHSTFGATGIVYPDQFSYKVQSERVPRFALGSSAPSVRLARVERELTLQGRNVTGFIGISGSSGQANFSLSNAEGVGSFDFNINGHMASQDFTLEEVISTRVLLKEFVR